MESSTPLKPISVGVDEAARLIGVARSMLYAMIARGELETFKLGKRRLIRVKTLEAFVKRQAQENNR
ncbi:helix-turn-helix domain-containing protein [Pseudomonas fulva]|uniref:helix-turn-helix domain-containing protein n=2 Tax=Pseudomonas TaxID=286 RepID=UPI002B1DE07A|nr:helix-turn-helix domain-containing protein [Pseudomonas fulva]